MIVPSSWKCRRKIADPLREIDGSLVHIQLFKHEAHSVGTRPSMTIAARRQARHMGYTKDEMTGHGFRSIASTLLHEQGWNHQAIERQLAHAERNAVSAAYNFAEHLLERRKMMQAWADYLDGLKAGAEVIPLFKKAQSSTTS